MNFLTKSQTFVWPISVLKKMKELIGAELFNKKPKVATMILCLIKFKFQLAVVITQFSAHALEDALIKWGVPAIEKREKDGHTINYEKIVTNSMKITQTSLLPLEALLSGSALSFTQKVIKQHLLETFTKSLRMYYEKKKKNDNNNNY